MLCKSDLQSGFQRTAIRIELRYVSFYSAETVRTKLEQNFVHKVV